MFNVDTFVNEKITGRNGSMFYPDIEDNWQKLQKLVEDKRLLVVGGAGTIGSSFIKAILQFRPSQLTVVDISENGLTELTRDLRSTYKMFVPQRYKTYALSFSDPIFEKIFKDNRGFDIVANFSAHKHVRSEKDRWSVQGMFENNVLKAHKFLDLMSEIPPEHFFCVSTDKAANPVNLMGASKRIMEDMIMSYSSKFKITTARFANVAFSNGSLLDGFIRRLLKHQPLSSPYDVKRYFVSPEESGQICMLACLLGRNREIFFPKLNMEQMMSFDVIADMFLQSLGYTAKHCASEEEAKRIAFEQPSGSKEYPVYYFKSDTTGEKGYEEFYVDGEHLDLGRFRALGVIDSIPVPDSEKLEGFLGSLSDLFQEDSTSKDDIVHAIKQYLPNFLHEEKGKNLDDKM